MKYFVIVKDDNIRYESIREIELCKRVNHEERVFDFRLAIVINNM